MSDSDKQNLEKRLVLLSFDGIGLSEFRAVLQHMPKFECLVNNLSCAAMDSRPFTSAAPVWAQLLTANSWYKNGCVGYSRPVGSLSQLEVFCENDLQVPLLPLFVERPGACIGAPLLVPKSNRAWLSDGSIPLETVVSPASLATKEPFCSYKAKPFVYQALAQAMPKKTARECFAASRNRLDCAVELAARADCEWIILRISLFDELAHLYGESWLRAPDLWFHDDLVQFLGRTDEQLEQIFHNAIPVVFSSFSHQVPNATVNLNLILRDGGFLKFATIEQLSAARKRRAEALAAINGESLHIGQFRTVEARLSVESSVAAAPISGCVYVNDRGRFADGCAPMERRPQLSQEVAAYVASALREQFGDSAGIVQPPDLSLDIGLVLPDFIVNIDGVELSDALGGSLEAQSKSAHASVGFFSAPSECFVQGPTVKPEEAGMILAKFTRGWKGGNDSNLVVGDSLV